MRKTLITTFVFLLVLGATAWAQDVDSTLDNLKKISTKYTTSIDNKINRYSDRITNKTEKTLTKLSRWENKIRHLLMKASPEAANRLFGNGQVTFTSLLEKVREGKALALSYQSPYNKYRDDISTSLNYIKRQKELLDSGLIKKAKATSDNMQTLADKEDQSEALKQFMKERKKQLIEVAYQYLGKNKYLAKINKEAYYYAETLRNYKELFADSKKAETTAKNILNRIPAFKLFMQKNSQLASLFGDPGVVTNSANLGALQTRFSVQNLIQNQIGGNPNALQQIQANLLDAKNQISEIQEKLVTGLVNGGGSASEIPDFEPNMQRTKTFKQKLDFGFNVQFAKNNNFLPTTSDISLTLGYKLHDKFTLGTGIAYKLGMGSIRKIRFTNEGVGLRSFIDWKMRKQFYLTGGYEINHNSQFKNIEQLKQYESWQRSALIGLTKKITLKSRWCKSNSIQILYDLLSNTHVPTTQPVVFRVGYNF